MRQAVKRVMCAGLGVILLLGVARPALGQGGVTLIGGVGGPVQAMHMLPDGTILLAEGAALLYLDSAGQPLGRLAPGRGTVQDLAVLGNRAYLLTEQGLLTVDLPALTVSGFTPGGGQALAVTAQALYVAAQQAGLRVALLDRVGLPGPWRTVAVPGAVVDVAVDVTGGTLYAALGPDGLAVFDLTRPDQPGQVALLVDLLPADRVRVADFDLLLSSGHRLAAYDLRGSVAAPRLLSVYDPLHAARDILLRQEWAYVADADGGLKRYSVAALDAPLLDDEIWPGTGYGLAEDDRYLYLAAGWDGVIAFDAGLPGLIEQRGTAALPGQVVAVAAAQSGEQRWGVAALLDAGVAVIDWRDPDRPQLRATLPLDGVVRSVGLRDTIGFAGVETANGGALVIFSVADLTAPRVLATVPLEDVPRAFALDGTVLYVATGQDGLLIVETLRPADPVILGHLPPRRADWPVLDVTLERGKRAYLSVGDALLIVDVDQPERPQVLATVDAPAVATAARNFIAYAVAGPALTTVNAASSNAPDVLGRYRAVDVLRDMAPLDGRLWLAGDGNGAAAVALETDGSGGWQEARSVTAPAGGRAVAGDVLALVDGTLARLGETIGVLRQGIPTGSNLAVTADGRVLLAGSDWALLDLTTPAHPLMLGGGRIGDTARDVALSDDGTAYFALGDEGIMAADGRHWLPGVGTGSVQGVAAADGRLYAAEAGPDGGRLRILDTGTMRAIGAVALPGPGQSVAVQGGMAFAGYGTGAAGGVAVLDVRTPALGLHAVATAAITAQDVMLWPDMGVGYAAAGEQLTVFSVVDWPQITALREVTLPQPVVHLLPPITLGDLHYLPGLLADGHVLLVSVSDPALPQPVALLNTESAIADLVQVGGWLLLAGGEAGLLGVPLDRLDAPAVVLDPNPAAALWPDGERLYVAGGNALRVFDVTNLAAPVLLTESTLDGVGTVQRVLGQITRRGDRRLAVTGSAGTAVWLYQVDGEPLLAASLPEQVAVQAMEGEHLYRVTSMGDLAVTLLAGEEAAWTFTAPQAAGRVRDLTLWGNRALLATKGGLVALEWGEPGQPPAQLGQIDGLPGPPLEIVPADGVLWLAGEAYIARVDVHDPALPVLLEVVSLPGRVGGIVPLADGRVAVAAGMCGLRLLADTGDGLAPVGEWSADGVADVVQAGDRLVTVGEGGISVLDPGTGYAFLLPATPYGPQPASGALLADTLTLRWSPAADPCQPVSYDVWTGPAVASLTLAGTTTESTWTLAEAPAEGSLVWQVRARDGYGHGVEGPVWTLGTVVQGEPGSALAGAALTASPTAVPAAPVDDSPPAVPGLDVGLLIPLLIGGAVLEVALVGGLIVWTARRRRQ